MSTLWLNRNIAWPILNILREDSEYSSEYFDKALEYTLGFPNWTTATFHSLWLSFCDHARYQLTDEMPKMYSEDEIKQMEKKESEEEEEIRLPLPTYITFPEPNLVEIPVYREYQKLDDGGAIYRAIMVMLREGVKAISTAKLIKAYLHPSYDQGSYGLNIVAVNKDARNAFWDELRQKMEHLFEQKDDIEGMETSLKLYIRNYTKVTLKVLSCGRQSYLFDDYFERESTRKKKVYHSYLLYSLTELLKKLIKCAYHKVHIWPIVTVKRVLEIEKEESIMVYKTLSATILQRNISTYKLKQSSDATDPTKDNLTHWIDFGQMLESMFGWQLVNDRNYVIIVP